MYGRLYCEFVMKKLCSFVGALQVVCLPVSVTVFQPTAEQRGRLRTTVFSAKVWYTCGQGYTLDGTPSGSSRFGLQC